MDQFVTTWALHDAPWWLAAAFVSSYGVNVEFRNPNCFCHSAPCSKGGYHRCSFRSRAFQQGMFEYRYKVSQYADDTVVFFKRKSTGLPKLAIGITTSELAHYFVHRLKKVLRETTRGGCNDLIKLTRKNWTTWITDFTCVGFEIAGIVHKQEVTARLSQASWKLRGVFAPKRPFAKNVKVSDTSSQANAGLARYLKLITHAPIRSKRCCPRVEKTTLTFRFGSTDCILKQMKLSFIVRFGKWRVASVQKTASGPEPSGIHCEWRPSCLLCPT